MRQITYSIFVLFVEYSVLSHLLSLCVLFEFCTVSRCACPCVTAIPVTATENACPGSPSCSFAGSCRGALQKNPAGFL